MKYFILFLFFVLFSLKQACLLFLIFFSFKKKHDKNYHPWESDTFYDSILNKFASVLDTLNWWITK